MNSLRALGFFMEYCNHNMDRDPNVTQERFQAGNMLILRSEDERFAWCRNREDVMREINWPDIR